MHSGRVRTARFSGHLWGVGVCLGGVSAQGVSVGRVFAQGGVSVWGVVSVSGVVCLPRDLCVCLGGVCLGVYTP